MASFGAINPSNGTIQTHTQRKLNSSDKFGKENCGDRERHMLMEYLPSLAAAASLVGLGAGAPVLAEVAASNIGAIFMDTSTDSHAFMKKLPWNIDTAEDIRIAVDFVQSEAAATGSVLWSLTYNELIVGTTALAVGATVLDTIIPSCVDLAADVLTETEYGVLDGGTLDGTRGVDCIVCELIYTETTIANAELLGVVWDYGVLLK